jgi:nitroreductase
MEIKTKIIEALTWRRPTRAFDTAKKVSDTDLKTILESAQLSPSSYGLEPWKFFVVTDMEVRKKLRAAGYDQPKITDASHLIVLAHRTDGETVVSELLARQAAMQNKTKDDLAGFKQMLDGALSHKEAGVVRDNWFKAQTYIALGAMITSASLLEIDNGPMEGFDTNAVNDILGLSSKNLSAATMLTLGYRDASDQQTPKVRRDYADVVEFI